MESAAGGEGENSLYDHLRQRAREAGQQLGPESNHDPRGYETDDGYILASLHSRVESYLKETVSEQARLRGVEPIDLVIRAFEQEGDQAISSYICKLIEEDG